MDPRAERIFNAANYVSSKLQNAAAANESFAGYDKPAVGIVLGSGLGKLAEKIENPVVIPYKEIPGFPVSTAIGHKGNYILGKVGGKVVIAMQGRIHYYEGYTMELVTLPIRVMKVLGIKALFVSNAAGGVNFGFKVGDLMVITDHINHLPNPLVGPNLDEFGPRFPDMTHTYSTKLRALCKEVADEKGITLKEGVYFGGTGPSYETPAEYRYFRLIGADAVGMSTIPEVIVARHSSIPVFGMSVITNEAHDDYAEDYVNDGDAVVQAANEAAEKMSGLFEAMISRMD